MWLSYVFLLQLQHCGSQTLPPRASDGATVLQSNETSQPLKRTVFTILWSCLLTVIICAWTSVHPNVPPQNKWHAVLRRMKLLFWTIVAPELILAWAVRQWFSAWEIRNIYNLSHRGKRRSRKWTMDHGHLLVMGGYMLMDEEVNLQLYNDEPEEPGWCSTSEEWERHYELERRYRRRLSEVRRELGILTFEMFQDLVEDYTFEFPVITAEDIRDRSKGDGLSKLIAIMQTSSFILQCVARGHQHLALTELELVTLALASLNAITFVFWWYKPLSVEKPIRIYTHAARIRTQVRSQARHNTTADVKFNFSPDILRIKAAELFRHATTSILNFVGPFLAIPIELFIMFTFPLFSIFPSAIVYILEVITAALSTATSSETSEQISTVTQFAGVVRTAYRTLTYPVRRLFETCMTKIFGLPPLVALLLGWYILLPALFIPVLLFLVFLVPFFILYFLASFIYTAAFAIIITNSVLPGATYVPLFYAPRTNSDRYSRMVVFAVFGAIFGGIHCIGWYFTYPTQAERSLWRITSVALTGIPLVAAPIDYVLEYFKREGLFPNVVGVLELVLAILLFVYVPARLSLIAQAFALLRNQPQSAFVATNWMKYIPHIL